MLILYAMCGLLAILGAILLTGRGTGLIAGYNNEGTPEKTEALYQALLAGQPLRMPGM